MTTMEQIGPPGTAGLGWPDLSEVVWQATAKSRHAAHHSVAGRRCPNPSAPYSPSDPAGLRVREECRASGCFDLFHEVLLAAQERLSDRIESRSQTRISDPRRYAHTVVQRLMVDMERKRRVRQGFPARPGRLDGCASRVREAIEAHHPEGREWLIALLRMVRDYAHKSERSSATWPIDGWIAEKNTYDGGARLTDEASRAEITADIRTVVDTATTVLGASWVHVNIHLPLMCAMGPAALDASIVASTGDVEDELLSSWLRGEFLRARRSGKSPEEAARHAALVVTGSSLGPFTPAMRAAVHELDLEFRAGA